MNEELNYLIDQIQLPIKDFLFKDKQFNMIYIEEFQDDQKMTIENTTDQSYVYPLKKQRKRQIQSKKKQFIFGDKERSSLLYKYIKGLQNNNNEQLDSKFSPEEDHIIIRLVEKYGPKFEKISKYFPRRTSNMIKNRYYQKLKSSDQQIRIQSQKRVFGKQIVNVLSKQSKIDKIIANCPLLLEGKQIIQNFMNQFVQVITTCQEKI